MTPQGIAIAKLKQQGILRLGYMVKIEVRGFGGRVGRHMNDGNNKEQRRSKVCAMQEVIEVGMAAL